jgi:excisionase family DNA binding protein
MTTFDKASENLLTTREFSERSGKSTSTVQKWLRSGKLSGTKIGSRWYVSSSELSDLADNQGRSASAAHQRPEVDLNAETEAGHPSAGKSYGVAEFSALTYLTETGVLRWLKSGRLLGEQASDGSWTVKAESLELPHLRHLIR